MDRPSAWAVMPILLVVIVSTIAVSEVVELKSSVTLVGLRVPPGRYLIVAAWGPLNAQRQLESRGDPVDVDLKFELANIRSPLRVSVVSPNGTTVFEAILQPTAVAGYRLVSVEMHDAEIQSFEVAEVLSMISIRLRLLGVNEEIKGILLYIKNESVVPVVQRGEGEAVIIIPPVVIDPGADLSLNLQIESPPITFRGSLVLVGERLVAGGSCDGAVSGAMMVVEHVFGLASFRIDVPNPGPVLQREVSRSTTEIAIRRGLPEGLEARIVLVVKGQGGDPIEDAGIRYWGVNATGEIRTDRRGVAIIDGIREPSIMLRVSKVGFKSVEQEVKVTSTLLNVEITLEREKTALDEIRETIAKLRGYSTYLLILGILAIVIGLVRIKKILLAIGVALAAAGIMAALV